MSLKDKLFEDAETMAKMSEESRQKYIEFLNLNDRDRERYFRNYLNETDTIINKLKRQIK